MWPLLASREVLSWLGEAVADNVNFTFWVLLPRRYNLVWGHYWVLYKQCETLLLSMSFLLFHDVCECWKYISQLFHERDKRAKTNRILQKRVLSVNYLYGSSVFTTFPGIGWYCYHVPTSYKRSQNCLVLCIMIVKKQQAEVRLLLILKYLQMMHLAVS